MSDEQLDEIKSRVTQHLHAKGLEQESKVVLLPSMSRIYEAPQMPLNDARAVARYIDHTLLKPSATEKDIRALCAEARDYSFASVCINPSYVATAAGELHGTEIKVCTVIGFPLGATTSATKAYEVRDALENGAQELDMVIPVGQLREGDYTYVYMDIRAVVASAEGRTVKVILETSMLNEEEKMAACLIAKAAGAHFVKTSTGFGGGGATVEDISLMRRVVGPDLGVKASGGVRDYAGAIAMINAGATRIGASASVAIVTGATGTGY
jgi:deoxyribose-phosphate aldolase